MTELKHLFFHNYTKGINRLQFAVATMFNIGLTALGILAIFISYFSLGNYLDYTSSYLILGILGISTLIVFINSFRIALSRSVDIFGLNEIEFSLGEKGIKPFILTVILMILPSPIGILVLLLIPSGALRKWN